MFNFKNKYGQFVDKDLEERMVVAKTMNNDVWEFIARNSPEKDELLAKKKKDKTTDAENHKLEQMFVVSENINEIFKKLHEGDIFGAIRLDEDLDKKVNVKLFKKVA